MARPAFIVLVLLAAVAVPHAWAQRAPSRPPTEGGVPGPARPTSADVLLSSSVIGARVQARDGTDLGEIHQLVIDRRTGYVSHAILDVSGPNAGGGTKVVVKWRDIRLMPDPSLPRRTVASVDAAVIERRRAWPAPPSREAPSRNRPRANRRACRVRVGRGHATECQDCAPARAARIAYFHTRDTRLGLLSDSPSPACIAPEGLGN